MITNGFTYFAVLVALCGGLLAAQKYAKSKAVQKFFSFVPPIVLVYLIGMILCTINFWDLDATKAAYSNLKNNILYAMIFLMLLRCDIRQMIKLGPKMIIGFFTGSLTVMIGFIVTFIVMKGVLGPESWKALGALCGSWIGGSGNMATLQEIFNVGEVEYAYALVVDSIDYSIWVMFLLWSISFAPKFNKWTKADTSRLDQVSRSLEADMAENKQEITFTTMMVLIGSSLLVSAVGQNVGTWLNSNFGFLDKATWVVLFITAVGLILAATPFGKLAGAAELSNVFLYGVVALLASRANFMELNDAPAWIAAGFMILAIHGILFLIFAKFLKLDMFTCGVSSLANIGGVASAPILAGTYSGSLVPVGVLMALFGTVSGTYLGMITGYIMRALA
ncbi:DUF819 family protein [Lutispora thermophila]|uniref:Uncharacterized membrane protein n=1 Tax=Lutispora thermophila DSM 19022 TaxID=1122184 RepID=A0A1M6D7F7_9FIRM|nr:DUF819 family protein [Lutispora thermophila]SHI68928.1 Uncharacterized membrane protein [Lutispora thermophila DSM 19022]